MTGQTSRTASGWRQPLRPCPPGPGSAAGAPRGAVDAADPMDAKSAPTGAWKTAKTAVSHSAHNPSSFCLESGRTPGRPRRLASRSVPVDASAQARHEGRVHAITRPTARTERTGTLDSGPASLAPTRARFPSERVIAFGRNAGSISSECAPLEDAKLPGSITSALPRHRGRHGRADCTPRVRD